MLPPRNRLTGQKNFERVQKEGKIFQSSNFGLAFIDRKDEDHTRVAFVVSNKVEKDATERNRVKRIMREAVRQTMVQVKPGFDIVFLAKSSILRIPTDVIMKEVRAALYEGNFMK